MKFAVAALVTTILTTTAAHAQQVKDHVQVEGAYSNKLTGIGVVIGLNGNGDSPKGQSAQKLLNLLKHFSEIGTAGEIINAKNAALVVVTAELPPFAKKGTPIDVHVSCMGDAKSLSGGELIVADLRSVLGREDRVYAMANGRVVIQGDGRTGNPTAGHIPSGGQVFFDVKHDFVRPFTYESKDLKDKNNKPRIIPGKIFRLILRKADLTVASDLALQINQQAVVDPKDNFRRMAIARAVDGGAIEILVPTKDEYEYYKGEVKDFAYFDNPVAWLDFILTRNVKLIATPRATVTINDVTKAVVWTDAVRVRPGRVTLGNGDVLVIPDPMSLTDLFESPNTQYIRGVIRGQSLIDAIRALDSAGLIDGKVESK